MTQSIFKSYLGGKNGAGVFQTIINEIPPHDRLIVPFAGHCAIVRNIKPCQETILIDRDKIVKSKWIEFIKKNKPGNIRFIRGDGIEWIGQYHSAVTPGTVMYIDPPYLKNTRSYRYTKYKFDLDESDHRRLLNLIKNINCRVLISTYPNDLYKKELKNWRVKKYYSQTRSGKRLELLYMNFKNPNSVLHDYSFAGNNFRERERIKRKKNRFIERFNHLSSLEKNIIHSTLLDLIDINGVDGSKKFVVPIVILDDGPTSSKLAIRTNSGDISSLTPAVGPDNLIIH